jgi:hypothetical protein
MYRGIKPENSMTEPDKEILIKAAGHLVRRGEPIYTQHPQKGRVKIGYKVPVREFERVKAKLKRLEGGEG